MTTAATDPPELTHIQQERWSEVGRIFARAFPKINEGRPPLTVKAKPSAKTGTPQTLKNEALPQAVPDSDPREENTENFFQSLSWARKDSLDSLSSAPALPNTVQGLPKPIPKDQSSRSFFSNEVPWGARGGSPLGPTRINIQERSDIEGVSHKNMISAATENALHQSRKRQPEKPTQLPAPADSPKGTASDFFKKIKWQKTN